jgi:hypothetical protein
MTRAHEKELCAFIAAALEVRHLLNCVPHDTDLTPEDREECLAYKPLADACMPFVYALRRKVWKEWERQRKEERKRKRAAKQRRQAKRDAQKKAPKRTR